MNFENKTTVDIIQELIAMLGTRREAAEKFAAIAADNPVFDQAKTQSDQFIAELLSELSSFGDAVQATAERENAYQQIWQEALGNIESNGPNQAGEIFTRLETTLKQAYREILDSKTDLPESLLEILTSQNKQLD